MFIILRENVTSVFSHVVWLIHHLQAETLTFYPLMVPIGWICGPSDFFSCTSVRLTFVSWGIVKTLLSIDMHHVKQRLTEHKKVSHCVCVYKEECSQSLIRWFSSSSSSQQVNFLISDFTARPPTWTKHHDPGPADSLSLLKSTVLSSTDSILSHLQQKVFKCTNWPRLLTWSSSCAKKKRKRKLWKRNE